MSATDIITFSDELVRIASNIPTTVTFDGFADVFDYAPDLDEIAGSPTLIIVPRTLESAITTTIENQRVWTYRASVYVMLDENTSNQAVENQMKRAVGHLIQEMDKSWDSTVFKDANGLLEATVGNWSYLTPNGDFRVTDLDLRVKTLTDITVL